MTSPIQDVQFVGLEHEPGEPELILALTDENDEEYRLRCGDHAEYLLLRRLQEQTVKPARKSQVPSAA